MDDIDKAQRAAEHFNTVALNQSVRSVPTAVFTGECLYCGEPLEYPRRWCDKDCCAAWERENS
jgi:hypothetical protein